MKRRWSRRELIAGLATGTVGAVAGCSSAESGSSETTGRTNRTSTSSPSTATSGESFTVAVADDPTKAKWDLYDGIVPYYTHVFEPLVGVSAEMKPVPLLATDWKAVDRTTWEFSLREDVSFHNGDALTADAVVSSFETVFENWSWVPEWIGVEPDGVTKRGAHTVRFETTNPFPAFPGTISHNYFGIQHPDTDDPVGTGPFRATGTDEGRSVTLSSFDGYRNGAPAPSELTFRYVKDPNTRVLSLEKGTVDVAYEVPKSKAPSVDDAAKTAIETQLGPEAGLAAVNLYKAPTDDETLRQALNWAVDQERLVESVLNGIGEPARGPFSSAIPWTIHDELPTYGPNREKASRLVERSDYDGETLSILVNSENTDDATIAEILKSWFDEIGVTSEIQRIDPASFYDTFTSGGGHLALVGFGSNSAACDYLVRAMFHSTGSDNRKLHEKNGTGVYNPGKAVDRLIEQGYEAKTLAKKREYYGEVQRRVVETGAVVPLYYNEYVLGRRATVAGVGMHPLSAMVGWSNLTRDVSA
ncbi:ABC transporter substrate-binding protein [Halococcus sp. IIIV-5B]|uniref:ABC transporter substrate-binding protein n=1 Tax=Halococcus sp. IIIV-5B TaxID=2321230 RepID=UPI000E763C0B|nr:ABC transporter substrate-binding protein [Halococcus sp. IIIV-5B]RJT07857.1 peptide ABC transporter substrate-binding protein [Halococcus sp. IIIV-5B]